MYLERLRTGDLPLPGRCVAVMAVGTIEAHGRHLALGTDNIIPARIIARLEETHGSDIVVCPPVSYGHTYFLEDWPGSLNVPSAALEAYLLAVCEGLVHMGITRFLFVNGHGGNTRTVQEVCERLSYLGATSVCFSWWEDLADDIAALAPAAGHAGEDETSLVLAAGDGLADMSAATAGPDWPGPSHPLSLDSRKRMFPDAMTGDARQATAQKGNEIYALIHRHTVALLAALRGG